MQKLKAWFGVLKQSYSCLLGIAINVLFFLTFWLLKIFPAPPGEWLVPMWFAPALFCIGILVLVGVLLVFRDYLKQHRLLSLIGFVLCCWPLLIVIGDGIVDRLTIQLRSL